jgi:hypothetical protein
MDFQARTKKYPTCKKQREVIKLAVPIHVCVSKILATDY